MIVSLCILAVLTTIALTVAITRPRKAKPVPVAAAIKEMRLGKLPEPLSDSEAARVCDFLNVLAREVYGVAKKSGFHDQPVPLAVMLQNLAGEQAELWESYRKQTLDQPCDKADKMQEAGIEPLTCAEEEMADIVIRALDMAYEHKVDIGRAVRLKNAFNKTRAYRHGGKIA